ncbi:hypothetical protein ASPZODRAFT_27116 [Penicilliopsis zonata CBS 506.65]|uniref:Uncharacterized protein n=1 Tax=Penicilliopsis zonata CBS 506.65 TaxID=1073090 RepID=A0A1L9SDB1_9EURO|nr:hypothetical protein ASPZODRAFT_27116 [Penicilliopsis zonata CBS 506.65]OJJ45103.1 hypothetical protein ASPZODRAFT_27116 [Penicilliopsis zonata CBS 506.65]
MSFFLPPHKAQGLANYPHARIVPGRESPPCQRTLYISGTSSRNGDGTWEGVSEDAEGGLKLDIRAQTAAVLRNIGEIIRLASDGAGNLMDVVDVTVFLTDLERDYAGMNEEWNRVWKREEAPARTTVGVKALPNSRLLVEMKCVAVIFF